MSPELERSTITAAQLRAARALVRVSAESLAELSSVSLSTLRRAEAGDGPITMIRANSEAVRQALETLGIEFISENGGGAGVRMQKPAQ